MADIDKVEIDYEVVRKPRLTALWWLAFFLFATCAVWAALDGGRMIAVSGWVMVLWLWYICGAIMQKVAIYRTQCRILEETVIGLCAELANKIDKELQKGESPMK